MSENIPRDVGCELIRTLHLSLEM